MCSSDLLGADTLADAGSSLDVPVFKCFVRIGLVPLMPSFFRVVLEEYGLCLSQVHPNSVQALAIFQHPWEAVVGVILSVALFRHFFTPRMETECLISGYVSFLFRTSLANRFIPLAKKRWDSWHDEWVFARFPEPHVVLSVPTSTMTRRKLGRLELPGCRLCPRICQDLCPETTGS